MEGMAMLDRDQPEGGEDRVPSLSMSPFVMFVDPRDKAGDLAQAIRRMPVWLLWVSSMTGRR
jgi:hypothetical protein